MAWQKPHHPGDVVSARLLPTYTVYGAGAVDHQLGRRCLKVTFCVSRLAAPAAEGRELWLSMRRRRIGAERAVLIGQPTRQSRRYHLGRRLSGFCHHTRQQSIIVSMRQVSTHLQSQGQEHHPAMGKLGRKIMLELAGKTAFVTGGASGIGLALGRAFVEQGMKVMLADIETDVLTEAVKSLDDSGRVRGIACDVADPRSVERAAEVSYEAFGNVHVVCNNAGVGSRGGIDNISLENWRWVFDVNVMGVLHGIRTFLPHIRGHGEGGHFVNTASIAGISARQYFNPYGASKHAVVSMSEGLAAQLEPLGIGVSVLCPGFVRTHIMKSEHHRPARYGPKQSIEPGSPTAALRAQMSAGVETGLEPSKVAARVVAAIRENELYVFTHPGMRAMIEKRLNAILTAMDQVGT